ncbi:MAG: hypothetical protein AB8F78_11885 [Saprospiraceae bacterium]
MLFLFLFLTSAFSQVPPHVQVLQPDLTTYLSDRIDVISISFLEVQEGAVNSIPIYGVRYGTSSLDDLGVFSPEYVKGRTDVYPIAFMPNTTPIVRIELEANGCPTLEVSGDLRVESGYIISFPSMLLQKDPASGYFIYEGPANSVVDDEVRYVRSAVLRVWRDDLIRRVSVKQQAFEYMQTYKKSEILNVTPVQGTTRIPHVYSLLKFGCRGADGLNSSNSEEEVASQIMLNEFSSLTVSGGYFGERDWFYWPETFDDFPSLNRFSAREIFESDRGTCGSWADLFKHVLAMQGIKSNTIGVEPPSIPVNNLVVNEKIRLLMEDLGFSMSSANIISYRQQISQSALRSWESTFAVKNQGGSTSDDWLIYDRFSQTGGNGSVSSNYECVGGIPLTNREGLGGQNEVNPLSVFTNHAYVKLQTSSTVFDPSYGLIGSNDIGYISGAIPFRSLSLAPFGQAVNQILNEPLLIGDDNCTSVFGPIGFNDQTLLHPISTDPSSWSVNSYTF